MYFFVVYGLSSGWKQSGKSSCLCVLRGELVGWEVRVLLSLPLAPNVRGDFKKGVFPRAGCCRDCEGESTKLSSRPRFPPAFPPHNCALDPNSDVLMK